MAESADDPNFNQPGFLKRSFTYVSILHQSTLDKSTPHVVARWLFALFTAFIYFLRVYILEGFYIVTYALGIYLLNLFIAFLTPKIDPSFAELDNDGPSLPTKSGEEFRPFMRRLPEFKFWYSTVKAFWIGLICTFFAVLDVPVFWPILVMYFCVLFFVTMKKQILHMIKYRYIPFTHGKARYKGKDPSENGAAGPQTAARRID